MEKGGRMISKFVAKSMIYNPRFEFPHQSSKLVNFTFVVVIIALDSGSLIDAMWCNSVK